MKKQFLFLAVLLSFLSSHLSAAQMYDFIVDGVYYKIQYGTQKTVHVAPKSYSDNSERWTSGHTGDVVIPESVTYNGETYPVEGIANYAFYGSSVTSVSIPASVQYIYGTAFQGCRQLTKIINLSPTPQNITSTTFDSYDCALYVPDGSVSAYQSANNWNNFTIKSVSELNSFGVSDVAVQRGTPQSVDINLDNISTNIVGFQFDLRLPEGFSLVTTSTGAVDVTATSRLSGSYTLRGKLQSNGAYRFVYVATPNGNGNPTPISGISGSLFSVKIQAGDAANDGVATVSNVTITDNNVNETSLNDASFNITVTKGGKCGDNLTWTLDDNGLLTIEGTGDMYPYSYPNPNAPWFDFRSDITSVSIGNNVTSIGGGAFCGCTGLISVEIPSSVTNIGVGTFDSCSNLSSINVSVANTQYSSQDGVVFNKEKTVLVQYPTGKAGEYAVPNTVTEIGSNSFGSCTNLTSVVIPAGVTIIKDNAFHGCSNLEYINIPDGVTSIGSEAFRECYKLSSISFPNSVTEIGGFAFYCCYGLTELVIPESLNIIQDYAFCDCVGLTSVVIPNTVTSIGDFAFCDCGGLTSFVIPNSVNSIGAYAFRDCHNLTCVEIPNSVTSIGECAFSGCSKLEELTNLSITPQAIHDGTFSHYGNLYVPKTSVSAYQSADYWKNFNIQPIYVASGVCGDNLTWTLDDEGLLTITGEGDMYDYDNTPSPWVKFNSDITSVSIGNNVTNIGDNAFIYLSNLTSISIPNSVTSIGRSAFGECISLTSVTIPNSVTSIGYQAFIGCSGLTSIIIPDGVTIIEDLTFASCTSLASVTIPNSVTSIGMGSFYECSSLTSVTIPNYVTSIGENAFGYCSGLTSVVIPNSMTSIKDGVFAGCSNLVDITIPSSVTTIHGAAFDGCENISIIRIEDVGAWCNIHGLDPFMRLYDVGKTLYVGGEMVSEIVIPEGITNIPDYAFCLCNNITSVKIANTVTYIGLAAFGFCSNLTSVEIPNSVEYIEVGAFAYTNLTSVHSTSLNPAYCGTLNGMSPFSDISEASTLYVHASVVDAYSSAYGWNEIANIIGVENGDVNLDNKVNVTDAVEVVSNVIGDASERFVECWSDVNSDNNYNIADAMAIVNIILGLPINSDAANMAPMQNHDMLSFYRQDTDVLTLGMNNTLGYSAFQFDVTLPEGMTLDNVMLNQNRCAEFGVMFKETAENTYTVAVFNFNGMAFATGQGSLVNLMTSGMGDDSEIMVKNIHFSTTRATDVQFEDMMLGEATGVEGVDIDVNSQNAPVYDISGRRLNGAQRGVNIVNGKKYVYKNK